MFSLFLPKDTKLFIENMISNNGKIFINWRRVKVWRRKHQYLLLPFLGSLIIGAVLGYFIFCGPKKPELISPCPDSGCFVTPKPQITPKIVPTTSPEAPKRPTTGKASYYSIAGCIGCGPDRIMANGQRLDDTRYTLANNEIPLNTMVIVENTRNGKKEIAKVTDRGGFSRYGRIADLSLALAQAIDLKTDIDILTITPVK